MNDIERRLRELGDRTAQEVTYRAVPRRRIARRARVRRAAVVAGPVAAVVLFAAVAYPRLDSPGGRGMPVSVDLAAAAEATERTGSARIEMSMSMEFDGRTITMKGEGKADFDDSRSYLRMTEGGDLASVGDVEMISIGQVVYTRPIGESKWVKTKVDTPAGAAPFGTGPDEFFSYLESVSEDVTSVGEETLDGVPVTHLRATLDPSALGEMASVAGTEYDPFHVWIDDANRVRKMAFGGSIEGGGASSPATMRMTMRFWDFGVPVDIESPHGDDVAPPTPEPTAPTAPDTYVVGAGGITQPHVVVESYGAGPSPLCVRLPGGGPESSAVVVDETTSQELFSATWSGAEYSSGQSYSMACAKRLISHVKVDLLLGDPARFTLRVGDGPDQVVVELAEVRRSE